MKPAAIKALQVKYIKHNDTHKDSFSFPMGSMVAIQCEDGGPWIHGVIEEANNSNHNGRSYSARVIEMGI